ncbi:MAG: polysaccharide biosynthesis/export family protein [Bacteroidales bacterium]|nr:polysaccharide biosynthesis/export family protein [Bacteroidales bacterium]
MKRFFPLSIFFAAVVLLMASCRTSTELAYFSDAERDSAQRILSTYSTSIHPGDQLYIYVYSQTPEGAVPFNQESHAFSLELSRMNNNASKDLSATKTVTVPGYLVSQSGLINFPILGSINVLGMDHDSLSRHIESRLINEGYLLDPVVTVSTMNFRVSVVGEVALPQELHITGDRLTILEAIAMCGDITIDGLRSSITVLREKNGIAVPVTVDMTQKSLFDSEVYYLQPNDIVYVEPNPKKKRLGTRDENWPKYVTSAIGMTVSIFNITRTTARYLRYAR